MLLFATSVASTSYLEVESGMLGVARRNLVRNLDRMPQDEASIPAFGFENILDRCLGPKIICSKKV